jgi:acyl-CoA thioester hydrolase
MQKWDSGLKPELPGVEDRTTIRVRYAETDAMGWVYYATYLCYFEVGRTELIRRTWRPYRQIEKETGLRLPVVEAYCRYIYGARYDDELEIHTRMTMPSAFRLRFDYHLTQAGKPVANGFTVHCFVGASGKPVKIPADLRALSAA